MSSEILWAEVRLSLDDPPYAPLYTVVVDEMNANEVARNEEGVLAGVKRAWKLSSHVA
jgi:hypothetical protein